MARSYMNRKADENGKRPDEDETVLLIKALGFRHYANYTPNYSGYLRTRNVEGITVLDIITTGSFPYQGSQERIDSKAGYAVESYANCDGIQKLNEQGKDRSEICKFHAARQSELEVELGKFFEIVPRVD